MRILLRSVALLPAILMAAAGPALAQGPTITASGTGPTQPKVFTPNAITVPAGTTVTFTNASGNHNVHFDGEDPLIPPSTSMWTVTKTFNAAGQFHFVCDVHAPNMQGTITVTAVEPPPTTPPPTTPPPTTPPPTTPPPTTPPPTTPPPTTPPPDTTPQGGTPPTPVPMTPGQPTTPTTPQATVGLVAKRTQKKFCASRKASCKSPGVRLRLAAPTAVTGVLYRKAGKRERRFGTVRFAASSSPRVVRFVKTRQGRRLVAGRYRLVLKAGGRTKSVRFRVT